MIAEKTPRTTSWPRPVPLDCVLIVDDDPSVLAGLTALLEKTWDVTTALTGRAAIAAFRDCSPEVVLLDVRLPDASRIELLRQFKMDSETVAVVMMSGAGTLDRVVESMKLGADSFLRKPFGADVLLAAMQQLSRMIAVRRFRTTMAATGQQYLLSHPQSATCT